MNLLQHKPLSFLNSNMIDPGSSKQFISQFENPIIVKEGELAPADKLNQVGFVGRDAAHGKSSITVYGGYSEIARHHPFKVICFYTRDNEYLEHANRLKACLDKFGVAYEFEAIESRGAWELNCAYKAHFVKKKWESSDVPVVWIDADATVESNPLLFGSITADLALHKWNQWEFCSGTVYFGKSKLTHQLISQWVQRCEADPTLWDQIHLCSAWCDVSSILPLKTAWLPRTYLQISDAPEFSPPIIKHWQASRASKKDGRALNPLHFVHTSEGIQNRLHNRLWRTVEEGFWIAQGTAHIKPEIGSEFPEGFSVGPVLQESIGGKFPVLEIGCGVGRIASLFDKGKYIGVDINPMAIAHARQNLPGYRFQLTDHGLEYPHAPTVLAYTVLLHVSDNSIKPILEEIARGRERIVIAELMDTRWRRHGNPPVFNRNPEDYVLLMSRLGFDLTGYSKHDYERYSEQKLPQDTRITFLTFDISPHKADEPSPYSSVALDSMRSEVVALEEKVSALTASTSWRITAPLRALMTAVRKLTN